MTQWDEAGFRAQIQAELDRFIAAQAQNLVPLGIDADRLLAQVSVSVSGGKRFRAAFCYWGYRAIAGTDPLPAATEAALVRACAALELLQASALVHDDFMDASDTRRGRPSTHRHFEGLHADAGWTGPSTAYGAAGAILAGDLLLSWADEMLRHSGFGWDVLGPAMDFFDICRTEVITGQFLDVSVQARAEADVATAMTVLRYKSAKYSVERPLHIGAALAGAKANQIAELTDFGLPIGEAFQLRDDLLGVFGDPEVTGKPAGDDLVEGKRTVLVAHTLAGSTPAEADRLDQALGHHLSEADVAELRDLITRSGAAEKVEATITDLATAAGVAINSSSLAPSAIPTLIALGEAATQRTL